MKFELSRFISKSNINGIDEINFQNNLQKIKTNNVTINDGGFKRETLADIATKDIYSFLSDKQKKELIENHIQSYIIRLYIKLLTGVNLSENEFILNNIEYQRELDKIKHYDIAPKKSLKTLRLADPLEIQAGKITEYQN